MHTLPEPHVRVKSRVYDFSLKIIMNSRANEGCAGIFQKVLAPRGSF